MVTGIEVGLLVLAVLVLAAVYLTMKVVKPLAYNAIVGLILLAAVNFMGSGFVEVDITLFAVALVAVAGVPGVVLVVLLSFLEIAFVPEAAAVVVL
ncbi:MAG: pro-sigmaK processing inhibitor BofA family protein [Halobacteriales archaeon]